MSLIEEKINEAREKARETLASIIAREVIQLELSVAKKENDIRIDNLRIGSLTSVDFDNKEDLKNIFGSGRGMMLEYNGNHIEIRELIDTACIAQR